jgi:hypothetical protein
MPTPYIFIWRLGQWIKMIRHKNHIILGCILMMIVVSLLYIKPWGARPFKDLTVKNISSTSVMLGPPGVRVKLYNLKMLESFSLFLRLI